MLIHPRRTAVAELAEADVVIDHGRHRLIDACPSDDDRRIGFARRIRARAGQGENSVEASGFSGQRDSIWSTEEVADARHISTAKRMKEDGHSAKDIAKYLGVSRATAYRYLNEDSAA